MSDFHEVSLPLALAFGASGGPERRTDVVTLGSGRESRNTPWAQARRRYDLAGAARTLDDVHALIAFFEARRGRLHGFRFRDVMDWRSRAPGQTPIATDQQLGVGDGVRKSFQLVKTYADAGGASVRPIRKPVAGSVVAAIEGLATSNFNLDTATGVITFALAPAIGAVVTAGFAFDTPVRFDTDRLEARLEGVGAGRIIAAPLIEIVV